MKTSTSLNHQKTWEGLKENPAYQNEYRALAIQTSQAYEALNLYTLNNWKQLNTYHWTATDCTVDCLFSKDHPYKRAIVYMIWALEHRGIFLGLDTEIPTAIPDFCEKFGVNYPLDPGYPETLLGDITDFKYPLFGKIVPVREQHKILDKSFTNISPKSPHRNSDEESNYSDLKMKISGQKMAWELLRRSSAYHKDYMSLEQFTRIRYEHFALPTSITIKLNENIWNYKREIIYMIWGLEHNGFSLGLDSPIPSPFLGFATSTESTTH